MDVQRHQVNAFDSQRGALYHSPVRVKKHYELIYQIKTGPDSRDSEIAEPY